MMVLCLCVGQYSEEKSVNNVGIPGKKIAALGSQNKVSSSLKSEI